MSQALKIDNPKIEINLNTIFEQDGRVYAVCSHNVPAKDLAKFIREELIYGSKHVPHYKMRVVTSEEFRKMPFGEPRETSRNIKNELMASQTAVIEWMRRRQRPKLNQKGKRHRQNPQLRR